MGEGENARRPQLEFDGEVRHLMLGSLCSLILLVQNPELDARSQVHGYGQGLKWNEGRRESKRAASMPAAAIDVLPWVSPTMDQPEPGL